MSETKAKLEGQAKEVVGKVTGDPQKEREGKLDQAKAKVKDAADTARDAVRDATR